MMPDFAGAALLLSNSPELSLLAKATLILAVGIGATQMARTARASARHLIVATSFIALIGLPIVIARLPALTIEVRATPADSSAVDRAATAERSSGDGTTVAITRAAERALPASP